MKREKQIIITQIRTTLLGHSKMQNLDIEVVIELGGCCLRTIDDFTGDFLRILEIDLVRG